MKDKNKRPLRAIDYPHLAARVFGTPLAISRVKLDAILTVLAPRLGIVAPLGAIPAIDTEDDEDDSDDDEDFIDEEGIAVIPVRGSLVKRGGIGAISGMSSYSDVGARLDAAVDNVGVKGIVLDIDSPGGEVGGMFELAESIRSACAVKPV